MTQGTIAIAAEGQEKETLLRAGDYLYLPGRQVHWGSCPTACVFYLFVDGPDSYIDVNTQRP
jgi:quercetin dioxygenase-like cupin family protein